MGDEEERKQKLIEDVLTKSIEVLNARSLYKKAYEADNSIEWKDVAKFWRSRQKFGYKGYNSYVANFPREQYHIDIAYMEGMMRDIMLQREEDKPIDQQDPDKVKAEVKAMPFKFCYICIDVFSKKVFTKAQKANNQEECLKSTVAAFNELGIPRQIYTDRGTEFNGLKALLEQERIENIQTRTHAVFAERFIRFMKNHMDIKIRNLEDATRWYVWLTPLTKYYNENPQGTTKLSPNEAQQDRNAMTVKANIVSQSKHMRKYPPLHVGDKVNVYKKPEKHPCEKSYNNKWIGPYKVIKITMKNNLTYYHLDDEEAPKLRHELLKL